MKIASLILKGIVVGLPLFLDNTQPFYGLDGASGHVLDACIDIDLSANLQGLLEAQLIYLLH